MRVSSNAHPQEHKGSVQAGGAEPLETQGSSAAALLVSKGGAEAERLEGTVTTGRTGEEWRPAKASTECPRETLQIEIILTKQYIVCTENFQEKLHTDHYIYLNCL